MNKVPKAGIQGKSNKMIESFKRNKLFFAGCVCAGIGAAIGPFPYIIGTIPGLVLMTANSIKSGSKASWPVSFTQALLVLGIGVSAYVMEKVSLQDLEMKSQIESFAAKEILNGQDRLSETYVYQCGDIWSWRSNKHETFFQAEVVTRKDNAVDVRVQFDGEEPYRKLFIRDMLDKKYEAATIVPR